MTTLLLRALATAQTPEARRAVGQASTIILVVALVGIVLLCAVILMLLRRRARDADAERRPDDHAGPSDAWAESAKRIALEEDDEIPREPGTA